jgi:hypothetical protein
MKLFMKVLPTVVEDLEKGRALPIGTRRIHGRGKNAFWAKKLTDKTWVYDGQVTSADKKAAELEERRRKMAGKMVQANIDAAAAAATKGGQAGGTYADRPTAAELATKPTKVKLYWDDTAVNDSKRELSDLTGILCLDDGAEDYVRKNLGTIFEMTTEQKSDFAKVNGTFPLGTDGKAFSDPYFMDQTREALQGLLADAKAGRLDANLKRFLNAYDDHDKTLEVDAKEKLTKLLAEKGSNFQAVMGLPHGSIEHHFVVEYIEKILRDVEAYQNNKIVLERLRDMDKTLNKMVGVDYTLARLLNVTFPDMAWWPCDPYDTSSGDNSFMKFLRTCGVSSDFYAKTTIQANDLKNMAVAALREGSSESLKQWFKGRSDDASMLFDGDAFNRALLAFRTSNSLLSKFATKYYTVESARTVAAPDALRNSQRFTFRDSLEMLNTGLVFNQQTSVSEFGADIRNMLRSRSMKAAIQSLTHGQYNGYYGPNLQRILDTAEVTKKVGNIKFDDLCHYFVGKRDEIVDSLSPTAKSLIRFEMDSDDIDRSLFRGMSKRGSTSQIDAALGGDFYAASESGGNRYDSHLVQYQTHTVRTSARKGWSGWVFNSSYAWDDFKTNKVVNNVLNHSIYQNIGTVENVTQVSLENHLKGVISYAMGMNYHTMQLSKKSKVLPTWNWGAFVPFHSRTPIGHLSFRGARYNTGRKAYLDTAEFRTMIQDEYNKSVAVEAGLVTRKSGGNPRITLKSVSAQKHNDIQKRLDDTWTHNGKNYVSSRGMKLHHAFEINHHEYFPQYKEIEQKLGNVKYLYHGTDFQAGSKIIKTGYKVFPSKKAKAGRMLGDGVYFADSCSKSGSYMTVGGRSFSPGTRGVLLWSRVALGKVTSGQDRSDWYTPGYDTNFGDVDKQYGGTANTNLQFKELLIRAPASPNGEPTYKAVPIEWIDCEML